MARGLLIKLLVLGFYVFGGVVVRRLLVVTILLLSLCEVHVALGAPAIKITPGELPNILKIIDKFDGKQVVCNKRPNGKVIGGRLFEKKGKLTWKSLGTIGKELKKTGKLAKAKRYRKAHRRFGGVCRTAWDTAKRPNPHTATLSTLRRTALPITLIADGPGTISYDILSQPAHGTLSGSGAVHTYTPVTSFVGADSFTYRATANGLSSDPATIQIIVTQCGLTAQDASVDAVEGQSLDLLLPVSDTCRPDLPLQISITQSPTQGTLRQAFPRVVYTPQDHTVSGDIFSFRATNDIGESVSATVTVAQTSAGQDFAGNPNLLGRYRMKLTAAETRAVLDRVAFGGTPAQREIRNLDQLVSSLVDGEETEAVTSFYQNYNTARLARSQSSASSYNARWFFGDVQTLSAQQLRHGNPFRTWMAQGFWHNHFTANLTEWSNSGNSNYMPEYLQRLQRNALGNYRDFIEDMLTDGIFHMYLNNYDNTFLAPNENFGREFLELFTAGIEDPITKEVNFTEADVVASTRALSGYYYADGTIGSGSRDPGSTLPIPQNVRATDSAFYLIAGAVNYRTWVHVSFLPMNSSVARFIVLERAPHGTSTYQQAARIQYHPDHSAIYDYLPVTGTAYSYRVRIEGPQGVLGTPSATDLGLAGYTGQIPTNPSTVTATAGTSSTQIQVSWSAVSGAAGYQLIRIPQDNYEFIQLTPVLGPGVLSFNDTKVYPNRVYLYYVLTVMPNGSVGQRNYRDTATIGRDFAQGYTALPTSSVTAPSRVTASTNNPAGVVVNWESAPGAAAYRIYRTAPYAEIPEYLGAVSAPQNSFTDQTAALGAKFRYVIRPVGTNGGIGASASAGFNPVSWNQSASNLTSLSFLTGLDPSSPNAAGKIAPPGVPMSARGWNFPGQPNVTSFVDHVVYNWPAPRRQLAAKLIAQITHRQLTEELVSQVAQLLLDNDFELKPVLRTLLSSSAMFSNAGRNTCAQSPLEAFYSAMRKLNLPATTTSTLYRYISRLDPTGYSPLNPPSVFGWKNCGVVRSGIVEDGTAWTLSSQTYIALGNGLSGALSDATVPTQGNYPGEGLNVLQFFVPEGSSAQPGTVVDRIASNLGVAITPAQRAVLIQYLNTSDTGTASPFNGSSHTSRVTGLIRMLTMSVDFLTK